jgi:alpha-L-fucosidase
VIHEWKAENWDPEALMALYERAGAKYFFALANQHDNFDNYDSKYQPWNSVNLGPKKDLIGGWAEAARKHGMRFGVSVHAAHAWSWYETAQGADGEGPLAGVPHDGKLTRADGGGTWWDGYDPQDLYAQNHEPSPGFQDLGRIHSRWNWGNGVTPPARRTARSSSIVRLTGSTSTSLTSCTSTTPRRRSGRWATQACRSPPTSTTAATPGAAPTTTASSSAKC